MFTLIALIVLALAVVVLGLATVIDGDGLGHRPGPRSHDYGDAQWRRLAS